MDLSIKTSLKENRLHGNEQFPLAAYWIDQNVVGAPILDCHWHSEMEFFFCMQGEVLFQVDTDYYVVKAGEAIFIDSGEIHTGHSHHNATCMYGAVVFDPQLLASAGYDVIQAEYVAPLFDRTRSFPRHIKPQSRWEKQLLDTLKNILSHCDQQDLGYELSIKSLLLHMLQTILPEGRHTNRSNRELHDHTKTIRLKKVISYIQTNYNHPLKISQIAEQIPMSDGQFCRFFKSMTRQTPIEYVNSYRIRRACELLLDPSNKISTVALDVGFDHMSYFVKVFRQQMNCTPSEYRKKMLVHSVEHTS
ncbi:helix-turn-helix transcriptional regulator [Paenibacillus endoradicis]|uniref:helix-turn-helix transcriptional regulator n=1 Tax=Paenibacillus endoradicis TaxID=2972487 RepID=UPI0021593DED|nr:AraC family transcriptional regulator [Paenibacillus endoradicis]MCR8659505.1 AraC family transcriptional regulator [Paenibacillus endoradicis]